METPAQLMRPAAPKAGKRVILERIPWIWKKLNFTTKSTIRNLLRYKKRFFMTVFGIGGCMALLLVGFGLKDSISAGMDSIRNSIHNMHDESIDLYTQVETIVKGFTYCKINFEYDFKSTPDIKLKYTFIAIIKEALSNIMKHSNATKVMVTLREHPAMYQLIISDNGTMDINKKEILKKIVKNQLYHEGMGLQNITDRVKSYHGNININLNNGFQIFITIPKEYNNKSNL